MYSDSAMAKDQMFKLRLDAADRARLEAVAEHLSAPAATAIRMLVKREADAIGFKYEEPKATKKTTKKPAKK